MREHLRNQKEYPSMHFTFPNPTFSCETLPNDEAPGISTKTQKFEACLTIQPRGLSSEICSVVLTSADLPAYEPFSFYDSHNPSAALSNPDGSQTAI